MKDIIQKLNSCTTLPELYKVMGMNSTGIEINQLARKVRKRIIEFETIYLN